MIGVSETKKHERVSVRGKVGVESWHVMWEEDSYCEIKIVSYRRSS